MAALQATTGLNSAEPEPEPEVEPEPEALAVPHTVEVSVRIQSLEALFSDLTQLRDAAMLAPGPACAYQLARVLKQTPMIAPMRVISFAKLRAASRARRVSALADSPDGATVDVTALPEDARAKIILVSHRWWSSVNAQPDRTEHGWVRAVLDCPCTVNSAHRMR